MLAAVLRGVYHAFGTSSPPTQIFLEVHVMKPRSLLFSLNQLHGWHCDVFAQFRWFSAIELPMISVFTLWFEGVYRYQWWILYSRFPRSSSTTLQGLYCLLLSLTNLVLFSFERPWQSFVRMQIFMYKIQRLPRYFFLGLITFSTNSVSVKQSTFRPLTRQKHVVWYI